MKNCPRHNYFGHLEHHIPGMSDHLGSDLNQLLTQRSQRALLHGLGQYQTPQEIVEVMSQGEQLRANLIIHEIMVGKPGSVTLLQPFD